jgi:hypothetical protein
MIAMQRSYGALKNTGSDLETCEGQNITDFFNKVGMNDAWEFDDHIEMYSKQEAERLNKQAEA